MSQFHFTPERYLELMQSEVPLYAELQDETARATADVAGRRFLELGTGTGETARRVLALHPEAMLVGIDASPKMLAAARLPHCDLRVGRIEDPLPEGPFDLVFSCLAVHHFDSDGKRALFRRIAAISDIFVLADVIIPANAADAVTPIEPGFDFPDRLNDLLVWLGEAGFTAHPTWVRGDLAVVKAQLHRGPRRT
ncbi:MAG TPA: class I SAM-dependent methyltransferase [Terriglobales bacterium]|nr:class I SAM-dependent methyltransferase [Terriglobales bacterium]